MSTPIDKQLEKTWLVFSHFVRLRDSIPTGYGMCITCKKIVFWKYAHAGHCEPKSLGNALLFLEPNVNIQCPDCNCISQDMDVHRRAIAHKWGREQLKRIERAKSLSVSFTMEYLVDLQRHYENEIIRLDTGYYDLEVDYVRTGKF